MPEGDRSALKAGIVQVMIQLSNSPNIQVQVGEAIAVMAEWDFPLQWADLVNVCYAFISSMLASHDADRVPFQYTQQLISNFSTDNFIVNNAVLQTAHAIFRRCGFTTDAQRLEVATDASILLALQVAFTVPIRRAIHGNQACLG